MTSYWALIKINVKLAFREKIVIFFNFLFPLLFFFVFGEMMDAQQGGVGTRVVTMVLVLGVLGNGLFGAGVRSVVERETNVLRRYKVTPISPAPILVASMVTGWILYMPVVIAVVGLAHLLYSVPIPTHWASLLVLLSVGAWAMRAIGLIVASVVNSAAESNIIIQLLYLPMLFLSGATFPLSALPVWAQVLAQFLPASYLDNGMERVMLRDQNLADIRIPLIALLFSTVVAVWIAMKIFRWEKEEVIPRSAKLWLLAVFLPFLMLGGYQGFSHENIRESKSLDREIRRTRTRLIRGARIFVGDGQVIESGSLLIKGGKIAAIYTGAAPEPASVDAELVEAVGKTAIPGLIDVNVDLSMPGGAVPDPANYQAGQMMKRYLAAYLYSGVTAVRSAGDPIELALETRQQVAAGEHLGADLFVCGPLFTAEGGYGTQYFKELSDFMRPMGEKQFLRIPGSGAEARQQVTDLKNQGVDGFKAALDSGTAGALLNRMDLTILRAIAEAAREQSLPLVIHTGDRRDVADAVAVNPGGIAQGSLRDEIPEQVFAQMARQGVAYDPALSVGDAVSHLVSGNTDILSRSLLEQVTPAAMIQATKAALEKAKQSASQQEANRIAANLATARENLMRAWRAGVLLVTGSGAGRLLVFHGPTVHRELQLWVQAGIPPKAALQAATYNAARLLHAEHRIGLLQKGCEATLLLVDGNPLEDISATERISGIFLKGERINRPALFEQR